MYDQKQTTSVPRCDVQADDLAQLDKVKEILRLLNEPRQSAAPLAHLIEKVPTLAARLRRAYHAPQWYTIENYGEPNLTTVLVMLGNRMFEEILFEYLEDLTFLRSSLE